MGYVGPGRFVLVRKGRKKSVLIRRLHKQAGRALLSLSSRENDRCAGERIVSYQ